MIPPSGTLPGTVVVPPGELLLSALDLLVSGVHFPPLTPPGRVGRKAAAVNLSDIAAMGGAPLGLRAALCAPRGDGAWVRAVREGLGHAAHACGATLECESRAEGARAVSVAAFGSVPAAHMLRREGARAGDRICVTGTLGDAGLALAAWRGELVLDARAGASVQRRLDCPTPRLAEALCLRGRASAAIDLSDGLAGDLAHICRASAVAARVHLDRLPLSAALRGALAHERAWRLAATAGDDYELCFSVPARHLDAVRRAVAALGTGITDIGHIESGSGVRFVDGAGHEHPPGQAWEHFR